MVSEFSHMNFDLIKEATRWQRMGSILLTVPDWDHYTREQSEWKGMGDRGEGEETCHFLSVNTVEMG